MAMKLEELRVLKMVESLADDIWQEVAHWDAFAKNTIGSQWIRATDSIGANIAEAFGRYHYGEKLQFLYYARGSLFESKYWLNRTISRNLIESRHSERFASQLSQTARQINAFANTIRSNRSGKTGNAALREIPPSYNIGEKDEIVEVFSDDDLEWLETTSSPH